MPPGPDYREIIEVRGAHMFRLVAPVARYTCFVAVSKRFLVLLVIGAVAVVVWMASDNSESGRLVFSGVQNNLPLENIMMKPHYQGVDAQGQPYTVTADTATQKDAQTVLMKFIRADVTLKGGEWIAMDAGVGELNTTTKQLELTQRVNLFYEGGYEFRTERAHVDIDAGTVKGDMPIEGQGPAGTLKADSFELVDRGQVIRFNGSVITTLYPEQQ